MNFGILQLSFLPRNKGDLLKINILRQNVVHNSDIVSDSIVHLHIFCIWFTQNCVIICQWQVQSWSFNWNYWFSASRTKKYSLQQRSSSRHIFTNFPNTNLRIFCFDFLKCSKLRRKCLSWPKMNFFSFSTEKYWWKNWSICTRKIRENMSWAR